MPKGIYDRSKMKKPKAKPKQLKLVNTVASVPTAAELRFAELMTIVKDTQKMVKTLFNALHGEAVAEEPKRRRSSIRRIVLPVFDDGQVHSVYEVWQKLGASEFNEGSIGNVIAKMARESVLERVRAGLYRNPNAKEMGGGALRIVA